MTKRQFYNLSSARKARSSTADNIKPRSLANTRSSGSTVTFERTLRAWGGNGGRPRRAFLKKAGPSSRTSPSSCIYGFCSDIPFYLALVGFSQTDHTQASSSIAPCNHTKPAFESGVGYKAFFRIFLARIFKGQSIIPIDQRNICKIKTACFESPVPFCFIPLQLHQYNMSVNALIVNKSVHNKYPQLRLFNQANPSQLPRRLAQQGAPQ